MPRRWDLFCRVIDNFGDVGVCWRLAAALARRGQQVRLWLDDDSAQAWLAPEGAPGVQCVRWTDPAPAIPPGNTPGDAQCDAQRDAPGDVVIEAFGCDPPPAFVSAMAARQPPPTWINLEYLSAERYVERSHGLPSPQAAAAGAGAGLRKWFYFPGFTDATGGLIHDGPGGTTAAASLPPADDGWLAALGAAKATPDEQRVMVFCYANPELPALLQRLARWRPTLLLAAGEPAQSMLSAMALPAGVRLCRLPLLPQTGFDRLLAACDFNIVRGEDSFVRAQLDAAPCLWQIYPQHDGAHAAKLEAFIDLYLACTEAPPAMAAAVRASFMAFNGLQRWPDALPDPKAWAALQRRWRAHLLAQDDLVTRLLRFVDDRGRILGFA